MIEESQMHLLKILILVKYTGLSFAQITPALSWNIIN